MDRRRLLRAGAVLSATSITGCVGKILPGDEQSVFKSINRRGTNLAVNLRPDANIQRVNLITPNGKQANYATLSSGESRAILSLLNRDFAQVKYAYTPGDNTVVAIDRDGDQHEKEVPLKPRLAAKSISLLGEERSGNYTEHERYTNPVIAIQNTGTAPALIIESAVQGSSVPAPKQLPTGRIALGRRDISADLEQLGRKESASTPFKNRGRQSIVTIPPNESMKVITSYHPFGFTATAATMGKQVRQQLQNDWGEQTASATALLVGRTGRLKIPFSVRFAGTVKAATTAGEEYMYFQNAKVTDSSIESSK